MVNKVVTREQEYWQNVKAFGGGGQILYILIVAGPAHRTACVGVVS